MIPFETGMFLFKSLIELKNPLIAKYDKEKFGRATFSKLEIIVENIDVFKITFFDDEETYNDIEVESNKALAEFLFEKVFMTTSFDDLFFVKYYKGASEFVNIYKLKKDV